MTITNKKSTSWNSKMEKPLSTVTMEIIKIMIFRIRKSSDIIVIDFFCQRQDRRTSLDDDRD